jgi:hypothetical protein
MYTTHGHWFAPTLPGEVAPKRIYVCGAAPVCPECHEEKMDALSRLTFVDGVPTLQPYREPE